VIEESNTSGGKVLKVTGAMLRDHDTKALGIHLVQRFFCVKKSTNISNIATFERRRESVFVNVTAIM